MSFAALGLKRIWDAGEKDAVKAAHAEIRRELGLVVRDHVDSIQALMDQGYNLTDIGVMFGVTHERIRQIANEHGLERADERLTQYRVWDPWSDRFVPVSRDEMAEQVRLWAIEEGVALPQEQRWQQQREQTRNKYIRAIQQLAEKLDRAPILSELLDHLGTSSANQVAAVFGGPRSGLRETVDTPGRKSYTEALDAAWRAAGYERPIGLRASTSATRKKTEEGGGDD